MSRLFFMLLICTALFTGKVYAKQVFYVNYSSVQTVEGKGGVLGTAPQFQDGLKCFEQTSIVDFCKFPTSSYLNSPEGAIKIVFKQDWSNASDHTNCLFNSGWGIWWVLKNSFHIQREGNNLKFMIVDNTQNIHVVTAVNFIQRFNDNQFHTIIATWNKNSGIGIYVDGQEEAFTTCSFELDNLSQNIFVGNDGIASGGEAYYYTANATIKSLAIYDQAEVDFSAKIFDIKLSAAQNVQDSGGVVGTGTQFIDGMRCYNDGTSVIDFCKFPSSYLTSMSQGAIKICFKQSWAAESDNINCLFNTGFGIWWCQKNTFHIQREGSRLKFMIVDNSNNIHIVTAYNFPEQNNDNEFHTIIATWDVNSGIGLYIDGLEAGFTECTFNMDYNPQNIYVGNDGIATGGEVYYFPASATIRSLTIFDKSEPDLSSQVSAIDFTSAHAVEGQGGILGPDIEFDEGIKCYKRSYIVDFCKLPASYDLSSPEGAIEIEFKQDWINASDYTNCLLNSGWGIWWCQKNSFHIQREGNHLKFMVVDNSNNIHIAQAYNFVTRFNDGQFHRIFATWNVNSGISLYVDGTQESFTNTPFCMDFQPQDIYIGNDGIAAGGEAYYFAGNAEIKSFKIYEKADLSKIKTIVYPALNRNNSTAFMKGIPNHLLFYYYGQNDGISQAELQLDLPAELTLTGLCQVRINNIYSGKPTVTTENITRNNQNYIRYHIELKDLENLSPKLSTAYNHIVYIEADQQMQTGEVDIYWKLNIDGANGIERILKAKVLPLISPATNVKDFQVSLFFGGSITNPDMGGHLMYHPDDDTVVGSKIRDFCHLFGINYGWKPEPANLSDFIAVHAGWLNYGGWGMSENVGHPRIDKDGNTLGGYACPTYIGQEGVNFSTDIIQQLQAEYLSINAQYIMPDYELQKDQFECFCPNCIQAFKTFANLSSSLTLTPEIIEQQYSNDWSEFLCKQNADILSQVVSICRLSAPLAQIYVCANYVFDDAYTKKVCHDVSLFDPYVDAHMPMIYYSGKEFYEKIDTTCTSLSKPVIPHMCVNDVVYLSAIHMSPQAMRMNMFATFTSGGKGIGFYPGLSSFDGEYYYELGRTLNDVATLKQTYQNTTRNDQGINVSSNELKYKVHVDGSKKIISVFNYSNYEISYQITFNSSILAYQASDILENMLLNIEYQNGLYTISTSISSNEASFILLTSP